MGIGNDANEILRRMRRYLGMTQAEVAAAAKIGLSTYQKCESGERSLRNAGFEIVCRILEVMDLDPTMFFHGDYRLADIPYPVEVIEEESVYAHKSFAKGCRAHETEQ